MNEYKPLNPFEYELNFIKNTIKRQFYGILKTIAIGVALGPEIAQAFTNHFHPDIAHLFQPTTQNGAQNNSSNGRRPAGRYDGLNQNGPGLG